MAYYVSSFASLSNVGLCSFPGRESICLSLGLVGLFCLVAAMALVFRSEEDGLAVTVRLERD